MQVLLIDDDQPRVAALTAVLSADGFAVAATQDAEAALALLAQRAPELVLLNARLADGLALDLLYALRRESAAAVIVLVGRGDEDARVRGLEAGADDYVWDPVSPRELAARIRALLRRHEAESPPAVLRVGPLMLDGVAHTATYDGVPLGLTLTEFRLLQHLMAHAGEVVTLATLLREVWGYRDTSISDVVRTAVYRLRQKLRDDPTDPHLLHTVPGLGFVLRPDPSPSHDAGS